MIRREFITLLGGVAASWPLQARGQQAAIGFLHAGSESAFAHLPGALRRGLAETDLVEGRNVTVEYRWAEGYLDRLPALAADLVRRQVAVIVGPVLAMRPAKRISATIPLVFVAADDPIKLGFVESLNRPGGSMTGVYMFTVDLEAKRLGLLRDVMPTATIIGVLGGASQDTDHLRMARICGGRRSYELWKQHQRHVRQGWFLCRPYS
jgi:putative tryptophan/tyrosine transport system substrate-binding protein